MADRSSLPVSAWVDFANQVFAGAIPRETCIAAQNWLQTTKTNTQLNAARLQHQRAVDQFIRELPRHETAGDAARAVAMQPLVVISLALDRLMALPRMLASPPSGRMPNPQTAADFFEEWLVRQWAVLFEQGTRGN